MTVMVEVFKWEQDELMFCLDILGFYRIHLSDFLIAFHLCCVLSTQQISL